MDSNIIKFIELLRDNRIELKSVENPWKYDDEGRLNPENENDPFDPILYFTLGGFANDDIFNGLINIHYGSFKLAYISNNYGNNKNIKDELLNQLQLIIIELKEMLPSSDKEIGRVIDRKIQFCEEVIIFINDQSSVTPTKIKKTYDKLTNLKQKEVVILFHHLKELGFLGNKLPNNIYSQYISALTGCSEEKIRQDLSHINNESDSVDSFRFQDTDYHGIKNSIRKLLDAIDKDFVERFPS